MIHCLLSAADIYPKVYHTCFFIVTYFAPLCLMVLAYIQICHKLWFQQVCNLDGSWFWYIFNSAPAKSAIYSLKDVYILTYRYLETHQWCKGSGGPCSAQLQVHLRENLSGLEPAQFALRSNRSEPGGRRHACWWWCSLCLHCVIFPSASSISWKGNHSSSSGILMSQIDQ